MDACTAGAVKKQQARAARVDVRARG